MNAEAVWAGWLALFLIYEIVGAATEHSAKADIYKDDDAPRVTLSRNVWDWFGVKSPRPFGMARRAALAAFMGILSMHFVMGWPGGGAVIGAAIPVALVIAYAIAFERG